MKASLRVLAATFAVVCLLAGPARAGIFTFSTGNPDGKMATLSQPGTAGKIETESADDFVAPVGVQLNSATFTGLLTNGATVADVGHVVIELYRVFPKDSTNPPSGAVPTRVNSPSDNAFDTRDSTASGGLTFTTTELSSSFSASNSVSNGIHPIPSQTTGGEGAVNGREVKFNVTFTTPFILPADHYFFVPQVEVTSANGQFLWLSAPKPIVSPGTPFTPDLQSWIRNANLDPNWLRVGTDIVGGNPAPTFNATFSLEGVGLPEPSSLTLLASSSMLVLGTLSVVRRRRRGRDV